MTGADHQHTDAVLLAAQWLADQQPPPRLAVPELKALFGLTAVEACEAIAKAQTYRLLRKAFA